MDVKDKQIFRTKSTVSKIILYDYECINNEYLYVKQIKGTPYIFRLFGFEIKMPWNAKKHEFGGYIMRKYINDIDNYHFFNKYTLNISERFLYIKPRVEIYKISPSVVETTYFGDYKSAEMYANLIKEKHDLICNEENNSN